MEWKDIGNLVGKAAPVIGGLFGGPMGASVGGLVAAALGVEDKPEAVNEALKSDPEAFAKIRALEIQQKTRLAELESQARQVEAQEATKRIQAVNETMREESRSEHWAQWGWRPFIGFAFGAMILGVYVILPLFGFPVPVIPAEAWLAMLTVLGAASWKRGEEKIERVRAEK